MCKTRTLHESENSFKPLNRAGCGGKPDFWLPSAARECWRALRADRGKAREISTSGLRSESTETAWTLSFKESPYESLPTPEIASTLCCVLRPHQRECDGSRP
jgi:hypothetical protein